MSTTILTKQSTETRYLVMDFSNKMISSEIINTVDSQVSEPAGLTFTSPTAAAKDVSVLVAGGTVNKKYKVTITVTTSLGQVLENEGTLEIKDT